MKLGDITKPYPEAPSLDATDAMIAAVRFFLHLYVLSEIHLTKVDLNDFTTELHCLENVPRVR